MAEVRIGFLGFLADLAVGDWVRERFRVDPMRIEYETVPGRPSIA
ncbi:hypothetical protein [Tautonia rosea]|nr:hypothetical protein [Tautonia rosea]